jgi:hypothetical protein
MWNMYAKYTLCSIFLIITQWLEQQTIFHKLGVQFSTILANINNFFFSLARFFATYFVPNIGHRYNFELYVNNIVKDTYCWFYLI